MNERVLLSARQDLKFYKEAIQEVSKEIISNDVSRYPIFILHKKPVNLGRLILEAEAFEAKWNVSASLLEEFVAKELILNDKLKEFQNAFKDPEEYLCAFIAADGAGHFVFLPYEGEEEDTADN